MTGSYIMPSGGFASRRGRSTEYDEAMVTEKVSMPPKHWDELQGRADLKRAKTGRKKVSVSEIIRDLLEPVMTGNEITANVAVEGLVMHNRTQDVRPISQKGRAPSLPVPFIEAVEGDDYYLLAVVGNALENAEDKTASIPDGYYLVMRRESRGIDGALMHVEWTGDDGKAFSSLRRFKMNLDGSAELIPLSKKDKSVVRKPGDFVVRGVVAQAWDGGESE
jgi:hypothetical protein